ncbi:glycerophosphodiester phosphodiesterase [Paenibacillus cremeus]|uniref:Glycerophosphodiester phosphodiesterase n=1 Tax=Paenibacillus cremeus TaxID=2163881 RepID=A0A559KA75_9BACL|nr:glycerophosphodiester phosphodiesterase family protein [Paenibacillus cremeus]TVY09037.1 glycerophosphodiester phosphodiesterase [Paenibacillus cremeus]
MNKILLAFALIFVANMASANSTDNTVLADNHSIVTAHRGSSSVAPENTLSSIRQAIADRAGYAELDVQETKDGVVVLMHDDTAQRTAGIKKPMWDIDSQELFQASAGAWFDKRFTDERVPTLADVIDAAKGKIKLNIELKNNGHQKQLAEKTVALLQAHDFEQECTVTSFDAGLLHKVKSLDKKIKTGLIIDKVNDKLFTSDDYEVLSTAYPLIDRDFMEKAAHHKKEVYAWTVNTKPEMKKMLALGVDSIITNHPDQLIELMNSQRKKN